MGLESRPVVTCFLREGVEILLLHRSESVGSYPGSWGGVAGHINTADGDLTETPETAGRREIQEETGIEAVEFVRRGDSFAVDDTDLGVRWHVHPLLFECDSRDVDPNAETVEWAWVSPSVLHELQTVPDLLTSYRQVAPTLETIRADRRHGATYLALRAGEVLRDRAAGLTGEGPPNWEDVISLGRELRRVRPALSPIATLVDRIMTRACGVDEVTIEQEPATAHSVTRLAEEELAGVLSARQAVLTRGAQRIDGETVATLSRSGTVLGSLQRGSSDRVVLAESRPGDEGVVVAEELADDRLPVTLTTDSALPTIIADESLIGIDTVVVGADAILPDGSVVNKVGTRGMAIAARQADVRVEVFSTSLKVTHRDTFDPEPVGPLAEWPRAGVDAYTPTFERTPATLVGTIVTESGAIDPSDITEIARRHRGYAEWPASA